MLMSRLLNGIKKFQLDMKINFMKQFILAFLIFFSFSQVNEINAIQKKTISKIGMVSGATIAVVSGFIHLYYQILKFISTDPFGHTDYSDLREEYIELKRNIRYSRNSASVGLGILFNSWLLSKYK